MRPSRAQQLQLARSSQDFVRLTRKFEEGHVQGYVLAVERSHFLLAVVSDQLWFDGFECFRVKDLRSIELDPYRTFAEAALKMRGLRRPKAPKINMESTKTVLESTGAIYPLITIHREEAEPDVCHIGQVTGTNSRHVSLLEIGPNAIWKKQTTEFRLQEITRINFGGSYEGALFLVAGANDA